LDLFVFELIEEEEWTVTDFAIKDHLSATMPAPSDCY
jgi:hypothetical protein